MALATCAVAYEDGSLTVAGSGTAWLSVPSGLLVTRDGGRKWSLIRQPPADALSLATPLTGWRVRGYDANLRLEATRDGGTTWRAVRQPCRAASEALVSQPTPRHGWILCLFVPGAGLQGKILYETRDGGMTWRLRARNAFLGPAVGNLPDGGYPGAIEFLANGRGWISEARWWTITTEDGGRLWSRLRITTDDSRIGSSVSFVSDRSGFILVDENGRRRIELDRTRDGGRTWHVVNTWRYL